LAFVARVPPAGMRAEDKSRALFQKQRLDGNCCLGVSEIENGLRIGASLETLGMALWGVVNGILAGFVWEEGRGSRAACA
jgi:hypothetical protein